MPAFYANSVTVVNRKDAIDYKDHIKSGVVGLKHLVLATD